MDRLFKIKDRDTKILVKKGHIQDETSEIIINWVNPDLRSGPRAFFEVHKKGGSEILGSMLTYEANIRNPNNPYNPITDCDCFTTTPGQLDCKLIVHSVIPTIKTLYMKAFMNMSETIKVYMADNLCRTVSIYIPELPSVVLMGIKEFLLDIGLKQVNLMYLTDNEYSKICQILEEHQYVPTVREIIDGNVESLMMWLGEKKFLSRIFDAFAKLSSKV